MHQLRPQPFCPLFRLLRLLLLLHLLWLMCLIHLIGANVKLPMEGLLFALGMLMGLDHKGLQCQKYLKIVLIQQNQGRLGSM